MLIKMICVFNRLKTHIEPWKPTSAIITTGIYGYSRNPIYVAFAVSTIGIGLMANSLWVVMSFLPASMAVYIVAIKKEEVYLEQKFGEEYLNYKNKVRRWL
jgi:protein-S-isoprenylcysteine O-methyltransferase Ste14